MLMVFGTTDDEADPTRRGEESVSLLRTTEGNHAKQANAEEGEVEVGNITSWQNKQYMDNLEDIASLQLKRIP